MSKKIEIEGMWGLADTAIPALRTLRLEVQGFKVILCYINSSRLAWATLESVSSRKRRLLDAKGLFRGMTLPRFLFPGVPQSALAPCSPAGNLADNCPQPSNA